MDVALWVDALQPNLTGIGRYTLELLRGLPQHPRISSVTSFAGGISICDPEALLRGPPPRIGRWERRCRKWQDRRSLGKALFHGPNYFLPDFVERGVITVHDLSVLRFPETHPAARIAHFEAEFDSAMARATHIITDTETVRIEILEAFSVDPLRVSAVPLGVSAAYRPVAPETVQGVLARYQLSPGAYGLCVSTLEPRKNIEQLIAAWRQLPATVRKRFPLVLAGAPGWSNERLRLVMEIGMAEGWLRFLGFVPEEDLPAIYGGCALFAYPSSYEGFGLPPLEAMASGVPVLVANRSCLPEVCGPAASYVDPDDIDKFASAIQQVLEDAQLRGKLIQAGLDRAEEFSWSRCVDRTVDVYGKALTS